MRAACSALILLLLGACAEPPSPEITHQAAGRSVLAQQHEQCVDAMRAMRATRNRAHHRVGRMRARRDAAASAAAASSSGPNAGAARAALAAAEAALTDAQARFESARTAWHARQAECRAIEQRMHEL